MSIHLGFSFQGLGVVLDLLVRFLVQFGQGYNIDTPLLSGVLASNHLHQGWLYAKIAQFLQTTAQPTVAVLGLTYKPGTSTLRRSASVALCQWLHQQGIRVQAHDPAISLLPAELQPVMALCSQLHAALSGADLAIIATEWPDYRALRADEFLRLMRRPQVIDPNHFLFGVLACEPRIIYVTTGKANALLSGAQEAA